MAAARYTFNHLNDLLIEQLQDLYDAEKRLVKALPKLADAAHAPELADALRHHERLSEQHVQRLQDVFAQLNCKPQRESSTGMKGLISEGQEMARAQGDPATCDAGIIAAAQRMEHYEIASYGCVRTFAEQLGLSDVAQTLQQTLAEVEEADTQLTQIAQGKVNPQAVH